MSSQNLPYGKIKTAQELGELIRQRRLENQLTQKELAGLCNVGERFIVELEKGKPTLEFSKVLQVTQGLGLEITVQPRHLSTTIESHRD